MEGSACAGAGRCLVVHSANENVISYNVKLVYTLHWVPHPAGVRVWAWMDMRALALCVDPVLIFP